MDRFPQQPFHAGLGILSKDRPNSVNREQMIKEYVRQARERINAGQQPAPYMSSRPPSHVMESGSDIGSSVKQRLQPPSPVPSSKYSPPPQWPLPPAQSQHQIPDHSRFGPNGPNGSNAGPPAPHFPPPHQLQPVPPRHPMRQAPPNGQPRPGPPRQLGPPGPGRPHPAYMRPQNPHAFPQTLPPNQRPMHPPQGYPPRPYGSNPRPMSPSQRPAGQLPAYGLPTKSTRQGGPLEPPRPRYVPPRILEESESGRSVPSTVASDDEGSHDEFLLDETDDESMVGIAPMPRKAVNPSSPLGADPRVKPSKLASSALAASALGVSLIPAEAGRQPFIQTPGNVFQSSSALPDGSEPRSPIDVKVTPAEDDEDEFRPTSSSNLLTIPPPIHRMMQGRPLATQSLLSVPEDGDRLDAASNYDEKRLSARKSRSILSLSSNPGERLSFFGRLSPKPRKNSKTNSIIVANPSTENVGQSRFGKPVQYVNPARASTTSLQGVITRALRLASNLESGRTASKFGTDWLVVAPQADPEKKRQSSASLKDMLAQFPVTPNIQSPKADSVQRSIAEWPQTTLNRLQATADLDQSPKAAEKRKTPSRRRRCCGMPAWVFVLIMILIICLAAAAVVIPIFLIVIPRQKQHHPAPVSPSTPGYCSTNLPCANGGTSVLSGSGNCQCLCANGFFGETCTQSDDPQCIVHDFSAAPNATVGSSIPAILDAAQVNYGIPLNGPALLSIFSTSDLSCTSENELVILNSPSSTSRTVRQATTSSTSAVPSGALPFAQVAILYVLQATQDLTAGVGAQANLQKYFNNPSAANSTTVSLSKGWTANLANKSLTSGSGETIGH